MIHRILITDPDAAFGQMLEEMLTQNGDYAASAVTSGARALAAVQADPPDLAIVDLSLADVPPMTLINAMRRVAPGLRVMLIPIGSSLPVEYASLEVQGILTKPFFIGDLGESIARALGTDPLSLVELPPAPAPPLAEPPAKPRVRPRTPAAPPAATNPAAGVPAVANLGASPASEPERSSTPAPRVRQARPGPARRISSEPRSAEKAAGDLDSTLASLATDVRAETVWVVQNGRLVAQCGAAPAGRSDSLLALVADWNRVAGDLAALVGEAGGRFRQAHFEGERYHIYAVEIGAATLLIAVCRADIPIGTLRLAFRSAGPVIAKFLPT